MPLARPGLATTPPPVKSYKYLEDPSAPEWLRSLPEVALPNLGDFVVLSIDPGASVSHLDGVARQLAALLPIRRYVALVYSLTGLPIDSKTTHPYKVLFVRQGVPTPRLHGYDSSESCIAILPNTHNVAPSREPIRPAQPLPWSDCYLEATYGFPFPCRITTNKRDYTPVLPVVDDEVLRIKSSFKSHRILLNDLRYERGADWRGPLDLVGATQLLSAAHKPWTARISGPSPEADGHPAFHHDSDEISVIGSDGEDECLDDELGSDSADDEEMEMLLNFEHMMFDTGEVRDPVVNVWYDLDMVTEIVDPVHFLEDVKRLRIIMDEAEVRLGLRPENTFPENAGPSGSAKDQSEQVGKCSASTPKEDVPQNPRTPTPTLTARLRAYLRSLVAKCSAYVRALAQRLIPRHRKKVAQSKVKTS